MSARRNVAIALGAGRGVAAWWPHGVAPAEARTLHFTFDAAALSNGEPQALADVFATVNGSIGAGHHRLFVALASPWTSPRELSLPPLRDFEARAVLERDAARYFPCPFPNPVVAVRQIPRRSPPSFLASDADASVLDALGQAAAAAGWELAQVAPAIGAWASASGTVAGRAFAVDGEAAVLHTRHGMVERLRRCRAVDVAAVAPSTVRTVAGTDDALELAAKYAPWNREAELVHPAVRARRGAVATKAARALSTVTVVLLVLAAALRWWGAAREARVLAAERSALRAPLAQAMAQRDSIVTIEEQLSAIARAERAAPKWSARLWTIAAALPSDAYLTAVRGIGDSVQVEGRAASAAKVFDALRASRDIEAVRATSPIRLDEGSGGTLESFSIAVRVRAPGAQR